MSRDWISALGKLMMRALGLSRLETTSRFGNGKAQGRQDQAGKAGEAGRPGSERERNLQNPHPPLPVGLGSVTVQPASEEPDLYPISCAQPLAPKWRMRPRPQKPTRQGNAPPEKNEKFPPPVFRPPNSNSPHPSITHHHLFHHLPSPPATESSPPNAVR